MTFDKETIDFQVAMVVIEESDFSYMNLNLTEEEREKEWNRFFQKATKKSTISYERKAKILILQTCYYDPEDSYLLLIAQERLY